MAKKQKSGLYRTKIKIGVDAAGKGVYKYISGHTKQELEQHRQEAIEHYINGAVVANDRIFGEYAQEWYRIRKEPFIRKGTKATYRSMLNKHILPTFGNRRLRSIRALELQEFLQRFESNSRSHITTARLLLSGIFLSACQDHILKENPAQFLVSPRAKQAEEKPALSDEERLALERVCATDPCGDFLAVLYYLGLRFGEAAGLKWEDFDFKSRFVHIQRKIDFHDNGAAGEPKTQKSKRPLPVPQPLYEILYPRRQLPDVYLFHGENNEPLSRYALNKVWVELMSAAGLTHEEKRTRKIKGEVKEETVVCPNFTPHTLRHNYLTMYYEYYGDSFTTMNLAGHTNISTTNNYIHMRQTQLERTKEKVEGMFENKSCTKVAKPSEH